MHEVVVVVVVDVVVGVVVVVVVVVVYVESLQCQTTKRSPAHFELSLNIKYICQLQRVSKITVRGLICFVISMMSKTDAAKHACMYVVYEVYCDILLPSSDAREATRHRENQTKRGAGLWSDVKQVFQSPVVVALRPAQWKSW